MCASEKIFQVEIGNLRKAKVFQSMLDGMSLNLLLHLIQPFVFLFLKLSFNPLVL